MYNNGAGNKRVITHLGGQSLDLRLRLLDLLKGSGQLVYNSLVYNNLVYNNGFLIFYNNLYIYNLLYIFLG